MRRVTAANDRAIPEAVNEGLAHLNGGRLRQAEAVFRRVLGVQPANPDALHLLGVTLLELGDSQRAEALVRNAISVNGRIAQFHNNLGLALKHQGKYGEATMAYIRATELDPGYAEAYNNLGVVLKEQGDLSGAWAAYTRALEARPGYALAHSNLLLCSNYLADFDCRARLDRHRQWAKHHAGASEAPAEPRERAHSNEPEPGRRLRVGYVSPDFRKHSVAYFFQSLLSMHDRDVIEVYCYASVKNPDSTTSRLRDMADHWRDIVELRDDDVDGQIQADGIDILVDLAGHTDGNRLLLFARKPAPVQVSYLGYCATTGLDAIEYRLTDAMADPEDQDPYYVERLVRLPRCFLCYSPESRTPAVRPLPAGTAGHVTFGSFNNAAKLTPNVVAAWSSVLSNAPGSRLMLKAAGLECTAAKDRYRSLFADHGIEPRRVDLLGRTRSQLHHLDLYNQIDIGLDPFPYNGTTTTCEAMWMGVPVITLAGRSHAGRVGSSLLSCLGLTELIAENPADYITIAAELASDRGRLSILRSSLRARIARSLLCDGRGHAEAIEAAYRTMWRRWCDSTESARGRRP